MLAPVVSLPTLGLLYWHLNINQKLFVARLGCGCSEGFNTNHLTYCFCFGAVAATAAGAWLASRPLDTRWRIAYLLGIGLFLWEFLLQFIDRNLWL
jgi:hypothetical protein